MKTLEASKEDRPQQIHYAYCLRLLKDGWAPADPDAELVEKMARASWEAAIVGRQWESVRESERESQLTEARAALAVVREHEAKS